MKMSKILSLVLALVMMLSCLVACGPKTPTPTPTPTPDTGDQGNNNVTPEVDPYAELAGEYNITMWVSEIAGVDAQFQEQIAAFEAKYPGIKINAEIEGVTEADAATKVTSDVASAPDIYCFAQDQLARLVQAAALAAPIEKVANEVKASHDAGSIAAASVAGSLYAYPLTADNGFYMFYDKSLITEEDAESMERLIEICNENGKTFRYPLSNGWYNAGFFFATGCSSTWMTDADGQFTGIDDSYNSAEGLIAMRAMQKLAQSPCFNSDNEKVLTDAAVIISGTWAVNSIKEVFGDNYAATDLPSFEIDGKSYHIGSFTGNKLLGVKPQEDQKRTIVLSLLAQYLTDTECQTQRFETFGWGPSNLVAQQSDAVQADPALAAFAKQGAYGKPQGQISSAWWDIAAVLGDEALNAKSDADLQDALDTYDASIAASLNKSEEELMIWSVIGDMQDTQWKTDFKMTSVGDGVWESDAITFVQGQNFKLRRGGQWAPQVGDVDGAFYVKLSDSDTEPANIVFELESGDYVVRLAWDGESHTATVTFEPCD